MNLAKLSQRADELFAGGLCCAEAIFAAVLEQVPDPERRPPLRLASGLCGGMGGSHQECCGALTGAILAIGLLYGRSRQDDSNAFAKELAARLREEFLRRNGSSRCQDLLDRFGVQQNGHRCRELTADTAELLAEILSRVNRPLAE